VFIYLAMSGVPIELRTHNSGNGDDDDIDNIGSAEASRVVSPTTGSDSSNVPSASDTELWQRIRGLRDAHDRILEISAEEYALGLFAREAARALRDGEYHLNNGNVVDAIVTIHQSRSEAHSPRRSPTLAHERDQGTPRVLKWNETDVSLDSLHDLTI